MEDTGKGPEAWSGDRQMVAASFTSPGQRSWEVRTEGAGKASSVKLVLFVSRNTSVASTAATPFQFPGASECDQNQPMDPTPPLLQVSRLHGPPGQFSEEGVEGQH